MLRICAEVRLLIRAATFVFLCVLEKIIFLFADTLGLMLLPKLAALFGGCVCNLGLFGQSLYCTELSEQMVLEMILELDWLFYAHRLVLVCPSYASVL